MLFLQSSDNLEFLSLGVGFNYNYEFNHMHTHDYWEFIYCDKEVLHHHNKKNYILPAHSVIIIKPTDEHAIEGISQQKDFSPTHLNLKITCDHLRSLLLPIDEKLYDLLQNHGTFAPITLIHFKKYLEGIYSLLSTAPVPKATLIKKLILTIIENYEPILYPRKGKMEALPDFLQDLSLKLSNPDNFNRLLIEILKEAPYSQKQINRLFIKYYAKNPQDFFIEQKMIYAKNLLLNTDYSMLQIALNLGFTLSHFDHTFKKCYSVSPSSFRKKTTTNHKK